MRFRYLEILFVLLGVPLIAMAPVALRYISLRELVIVSFILVVWAIAWDIWSTRHGKRDRLWTWCFSRKTTSGLMLYGQPIEEYLLGAGFFIWIVFFWEILERAVASGNTTHMTLLGGVAAWDVLAAIFVYRWQAGGK